MTLKEVANQARSLVVQMSHYGGAAHLASSLSCVDILVVLYESILQIDIQDVENPNRDRFILSKGHAAAALYSVMENRGLITREQLGEYAKSASVLQEHPTPLLGGIEAATGSLGHGLAIGNGMALAGRLNKLTYRVYVLLSDGECNEGSVWEAAMFASANNLGNLSAIIDFNKWQATGRSQDVLSLDPLTDKWRSFGWATDEVDGHDHTELERALSKRSHDRPQMIIAHTVKGKGVSFMEDDNNWHYRIPSVSEMEKSFEELGISCETLLPKR